MEVDFYVPKTVWISYLKFFGIRSEEEISTEVVEKLKEKMELTTFARFLTRAIEGQDESVNDTRIRVYMPEPLIPILNDLKKKLFSKVIGEEIFFISREVDWVYKICKRLPQEIDYKYLAIKKGAIEKWFMTHAVYKYLIDIPFFTDLSEVYRYCIDLEDVNRVKMMFNDFNKKLAEITKVTQRNKEVWITNEAYGFLKRVKGEIETKHITSYVFHKIIAENDELISEYIESGYIHPAYVRFAEKYTENFEHIIYEFYDEFRNFIEVKKEYSSLMNVDGLKKDIIQLLTRNKKLTKTEVIRILKEFINDLEKDLQEQKQQQKKIEEMTEEEVKSLTEQWLE